MPWAVGPDIRPAESQQTTKIAKQRTNVPTHQIISSVTLTKEILEPENPRTPPGTLEPGPGLTPLPVTTRMMPTMMMTIACIPRLLVAAHFLRVA